MSHAFKCDICKKLQDSSLKHEIENEITWKMKSFYYIFGFKIGNSYRETSHPICSKILFKDICGNCNVEFSNAVNAAIINFLKKNYKEIENEKS